MPAEIVIARPVIHAAGDSERASSRLPGRLGQATLRISAGLTRAIPVPAVVKRHVSKRDAAFIAAAYAIPLPGTALIAALIVGIRLGYGRLRLRLERRALTAAGNG